MIEQYANEKGLVQFRSEIGAVMEQLPLFQED
jgi:hypothetical protein